MKDKKIITLISQIWNECPHLRFNQMMYLLQLEYNNDNKLNKAFFEARDLGNTESVTHPDLFNVEDEDFERFLEKYLEDLRG